MTQPLKDRCPACGMAYGRRTSCRHLFHVTGPTLKAPVGSDIDLFTQPSKPSYFYRFISAGKVIGITGAFFHADNGSIIAYEDRRYKVLGSHTRDDRTIIIDCDQIDIPLSQK